MENCQNLFETICNFKNLYQAYLQARKCKRYRQDILDFGYRLEENLLKLEEELSNQNYQHGGYRQFVVCDSKKRQIEVAPFRDRVVHHALCNIIDPIFDQGFIFDSYACRQDKGTHRAVKRLQQFLRKLLKSKLISERERESKLVEKICPIRYKFKTKISVSDYSVNNTFNDIFKLSKKVFVLKCDISKYFQNVDHNILFNLIKKKIRDKKVLWLIKLIIESYYPGLPIGNLTSQLFANIYLNELDQFVKHQLRIKYYLRYMDDFLILGYNKKELWKIKNRIQEFLANCLKLELNPKRLIIQPANKGIDFLGYIVFPNYQLLRKSTVKRYLKKTKLKIKKSVPLF